MTARSIDWPWTLTKLCLALFLAHFLFIIGAGLLLPADWSLVASLTAIGLVFLAIVLFLVVICDYRSSRIVGPRNLLKGLAIGFLVIGAAEVLERTYGFNWWLTAAAIAMIVAPIWWLYLRRSKNGRHEQRRWDATE
jgi:hypothetical protein